MYDAGKIITGLVIALVILTFPLWYNIGADAPPAPEPVISPVAAAYGTCVRPTEYMRKSHMQVLDDWRNLVVRDGKRWEVTQLPEFTTDDIQLQVIHVARRNIDNTLLDIPGLGRVRELLDVDATAAHVEAGAVRFEMSLQNTCMDCHDSKEQFCDQCHDYVEVSPFCWDCHLPPEGLEENE
jgi:hypothetical protein